MFGDLNPGILIGGAAAAISVLAALAAVYLWSVNRTRQKLDPTLDPQTRVVAPWLVPLLLPTLVILCLARRCGRPMSRDLGPKPPQSFSQPGRRFAFSPSG
jgi:hypothetical protein